jgi:hypothetical protein
LRNWTATVVNQKEFVSTAVLEYFSSRFVVAWADFPDTTVIKLWKWLKVAVFSKAFCSSYCQFRKISFLSDSTENNFWFLYCHFMMPWQS